MTKREAAVLEVYTGTVMLEEDDRKYTQQYIEKLAWQILFLVSA